MDSKERIEDNRMPQRNGEAKDEMNLAEFPLCALAHRLNPEVKTLRFEDRVLDKGRNEWITRQLTVTGSDAYGLPTEKDDEVLLGLIQLTRLHGFADRKVPFTRHELIRMLGHGGGRDGSGGKAVAVAAAPVAARVTVTSPRRTALPKWACVI